MDYSATPLTSTSCSSYVISDGELEALKGALLELQAEWKRALKKPKQCLVWNRNCQLIDSIIRNVETGGGFTLSDGAA